MKINPKKLLFVATLLLFAIPSISWAINITVPQPNSYGDVLIGTNNKTYTPVATSTLGIVAGGFSFPFTVHTNYNSTSTVIGFNGLFSTASSTFSSNLFLTSLSQGLLYIGSNSLVNSVSTSTLTATSPLTGSFVQIGSGGALGCQVASGSQAGCLSSTDWNTFNGKGSGTLTAVTGTFPIFSSGGVTPNITFGGLSTSSAAVIGNIPYFSSANTFANVATGTITCTGTASCTTTGLSVIGGNLTITGATSGSGTISTSSPLVAPQVLYATGVNTVASAATSTLAIGSSLSNSGALGFQIGGSASSLSINTANTNTWSVLQNFLYSSTTGYASFQVSSSTSLIGGTLTLPNISGTQCLHSISGVVSGTGSDCGSGGSSSAGPINTLQASNGSGGFIATGTPQLTVGNLISTTTIASSFLGDLVIGNNGVDGGNVGSGTILKNDGTIETTGTIENLNTNQDLSIANTVGRDILFKTSLTNSLNTTMTVYRSGLVGIGIAAPSYQLEVASSTIGNKAFIGITDPSAGTDKKHWWLANEGGNLYIGTSTDALATSSISALNIIGSTGLVGIATDTPFAKLSINPQAGISSFVIGSSTGTSLIVDKLGNVGIGLANPSSYGTIAGNFNPSNLVVQGSTNNTGIFINTATHSASGGAGIIGYSDSGAALVSGDRLGFFLLGGSENSAHELDNSAGMIGLATQTWTNTAAGSQLQFQVTPNNSETRSIAMTIDQSGDVGIGTTTPTIALDVVGSGSNTASGLSLLVDSYTPTPSASPIVMRVARGTSASPTAIQSGDIIGGFNSRPFGQNTFAAGGIGGMIFVADQNYSNTAMGSYGAIFTTPDNTVTNLERMRILSNGYGGFATATPTYEFTIASSTGPQLALSASSGLSQWTMANEGGLFYLSTTTVAGTATSSTAALTVDNNGKVIANCFSNDGSTCISGGGGSGTVTSVATGINTHGGTITTTGTVTSNSAATLTVSTSTTSGDYTDVQSAINDLPSTGGLIHITCGTFTLPTANVGIQPKVSNTIIEGEGTCTKLQFDKANTANAYEPATSDIENLVLRDVYIHQTNATFGGIGINASNTPIFLAQNIKIDGTATSTSIKDTLNLSFYQHYIHIDARDNTSGLDIGGNPVNDNIFDDFRVAPHSGNNGFCYYITSSSVNGAQANLFLNANCEPTGAGTGITGIYADNTVDDTWINPYIEANATGWRFTANSQRNTIQGGEFITNTTYVNAGSNNSWSTDKEGVYYSAMTASTTIADVSGNDASVPSLSLIGNTSFAKVADGIFVNDLINSSDSGNGVRINNAGTGAGIRINSTGTGQAGTTTGTWFMHGLAVSTSGNAVCINTSTFSLENAGAGACVVSTLKAKHDISTIDGSIANEVMNLNPVEYTLNGGDEQRYGFIAEEAAKIDPKLVEYAQEDTSVTGVDGKPAIVKKGEPLTFDYARYTGLLTKFVQDEQKQIDNLKVGVTRSVEENYQWIVIGLLVIWNVYLTKRKR